MILGERFTLTLTRTTKTIQLNTVTKVTRQIYMHMKSKLGASLTLHEYPNPQRVSINNEVEGVISNIGSVNCAKPEVFEVHNCCSSRGSLDYKTFLEQSNTIV